MQAYDDSDSFSAVKTFFSWHGCDDLVDIHRVALFACLHILDNRNNTTCKYGRHQRCFAPLDHGKDICEAYRDFCFFVEDPLISEGDHIPSDRATRLDADGLPFKLALLFKAACCTDHVQSARPEELWGSAMYYMPAVIDWRRQFFRTVSNGLPQPRKPSSSSFRISRILSAPQLRLPSRQHEQQRLPSLDEDDRSVPEATRLHARKFTLNSTEPYASSAQQRLHLPINDVGSAHHLSSEDIDSERKGSDSEGKSSDDIPLKRQTRLKPKRSGFSSIRSMLF